MTQQATNEAAIIQPNIPNVSLAAKTADSETDYEIPKKSLRQRALEMRKEVTLLYNTSPQEDRFANVYFVA